MRTRPISSTLLWATLFLAPAPSLPADPAGQVVRIHDGDTLTIQAGRGATVVRLKDIDAPELSQPYGVASRGSLLALCPVGSYAEATGKDRDRYGRLIVSLNCGGQDAAVHQVRSGAAWVFRRYVRADSPLFLTEIEAKSAKRGLWANPDPVPPWQFRKKSP